MYLVALISQLMSQPTFDHLNCMHQNCVMLAAWRIVLSYHVGVVGQLICYIDVDWAGSVGDCRSTSGCALSLGSAAVSWWEKAAHNGTVEHWDRIQRSGCRHMRSHLAKETTQGFVCGGVWPNDGLLWKPQQYPVSEEPHLHARTKHSEMHYHFVSECVLSGEVELLYVPTDRQVAEIFTKPLGLDKLRHFSSEVGLQRLDVPTLRRRSREREAKRKESPTSWIGCGIRPRDGWRRRGRM